MAQNCGPEKKRGSQNCRPEEKRGFQNWGPEENMSLKYWTRKENGFQILDRKRKWVPNIGPEIWVIN